jgi:intracellular septation protein
MSESETTKAGTGTHESGSQQLLKFIVELGPLLVFFLVNWQAGKYLADPKQAIFWGTGFFVVATLLSLIASRFLFGRVPVMPLVSGAVVLVFGSLTLWLQDDLFIKLKPTIVNAIFASVLFGGLFFGKSLLRYLFGDVFALTEEGWKKLTFRWACFFVFLAVLNEFAWRLLTTDQWVSFKVFAIMPITMAFAISQVGLLQRHALNPPEGDE